MRRAVAVITTPSCSKVSGHVSFLECRDGRTRISIALEGVPPGKHGFHIHKSGDLRGGCSTLCSHFNPFGTTHGGRKSKVRHVGDLGNIEPDSKGRVKQIMFDDQVKLSGKYSVIGRSIVIHADEDDLGKGGHAESLTTGNAGKRIACGVIGIVC